MLRIPKSITRLMIFFIVFQMCSIVTEAAVRIFNTDTVFEAENGIINNGMLTKYDNRASGGAYITSTTKVVSNASDITIEDLSWLIDIKETGQYHVYMRTYRQNTVFYRFNTEKWIKKDFGATNDGPLWLEVDCVTLNAGVNKLQMNHSDRSGWLDALYVTQDPDSLPQTLDGVQPFKTANTEGTSLYTVVSKQKKIPQLTGSGLVMEAEDATVCSPYIFAANKAASGMKGIKSTATNLKSVPGGTQGQVEFRFTCEKSGTYSVWIRTYATATNQDSLYAAMNNEKYVFMELTISNDFVWKKCLSAKLAAGEENVFRIYGREPNAVIDNILITDKRFTPSGRTGNIPDETAESSISAPYAIPTVTPPAEHPRVLFRKSDIERIKANMEKPQNAAAKSRLEKQISEPITGEISNKFDSVLLAKIEAFAFDYAIRGNQESGAMAVNAILNYLDGCSVENSSADYVTRNGGLIIYAASEVYDWCYDLLSNKQKSRIIAACEGLADMMEIGWPPTRQGSVTTHGSEAQLLRCMLAFSIATYDERPDIWNVVGGRFYEEYVPARNYLNVGHYSSQGDSYGLYRHIWDSWSHFLITGMGADAPYISEDLYKVSYNSIYMRRPDGQLMRDGDTAIDSTNVMWKYWSDRSTSYMFDAAIGKDPYLKDEFSRETKNMSYGYDSSAVMYLVFNDPDMESKSIYNLPLSAYFPYPAGMSVARTGWEDGVCSPAVVAEMKIGGLVVNAHQHTDAGHFQIYYKGILASDSGVYEGANNAKTGLGTGYGAPHQTMYEAKTIAHNTMLVYDPSEPIEGSTARSNINDGGQRSINGSGEFSDITNVLNGNAQVASTEGEEIDPSNSIEPAYTYLKGDLTKAYSSKVKEFKRSFMFLNLFDDEVPAAMIVFDKVTSSNPSFKKTWLLHGLEEPIINGNQTVFSRTYKSSVYANGYNGKMTVDTLLPAKDNSVITKVGGEDGWSNVNGVDYPGEPLNSHTDEGSTWRIELSPKEGSATDYFLNVIQVSDNDKNYYLGSKLIDTQDFYGVQISDRVVMFSKSGDRINNEISFTAPGEGKMKYTVCDAKSGTWNVTTPGGEEKVYVTEEGGVISVTASAGNFKAEYLGKENTAPEKAVTETNRNEIVNYNLKIDSFYVYTAGGLKPQNGTMMLNLDTFAKYFNLTYNSDGDNVTVTDGKNNISLTVGSNKAIKNSEEATLSENVTYDNGKILVPVRSFSELFGIGVDWDNFSKTVFLTFPEVDYTLPKEGYAQYESVTPDAGAVDGKNVATNSTDGKFDTIWASLGEGRYVDYKFDKVYVLENAEILFNPNSSRNAKFDIQVSDDGVNFKTVYSGQSDGSLEKEVWEKYTFEKPVSTRYVRYVANGSNVSLWNAIKEIRFKTAR